MVDGAEAMPPGPQQQVHRRPHQAGLLQPGLSHHRAVQEGRQKQRRRRKQGPVQGGIHRVLGKAVLPPQEAHQRQGRHGRRVAQQQPRQAAEGQTQQGELPQLAAKLGAHVCQSQGKQGQQAPPQAQGQGAPALEDPQEQAVIQQVQQPAVAPAQGPQHPLAPSSQICQPFHLLPPFTLPSRSGGPPPAAAVLPAPPGRG